jgi:hypothetical protein
MPCRSAANDVELTSSFAILPRVSPSALWFASRLDWNAFSTAAPLFRVRFAELVEPRAKGVLSLAYDVECCEQILLRALGVLRGIHRLEPGALLVAYLLVVSGQIACALDPFGGRYFGRAAAAGDDRRHHGQCEHGQKEHRSRESQFHPHEITNRGDGTIVPPRLAGAMESPMN